MDELISVVVSTYNWPEALDLSLKSLSVQTDSNFEIVVADDGSRADTAQLVDEWRRKSPVKIIHSWQEDKGFRLARSRNVAVTRSSGKYLMGRSIKVWLCNSRFEGIWIQKWGSCVIF